MSQLLKPGLDAIARKTASLESQILEGACRDFTEYKAKVAERKGLKDAAQLMQSHVNDED